MPKPKSFCLLCLLTEIHAYLEYQRDCLAGMIADETDEEAISNLSDELEDVMRMLEQLDFALPANGEHGERAALH